MSSLLNVSHVASRKPEVFSLKDIEVFVDSEEENWFKLAHVRKLLGIKDIRASLNGLEEFEILTRQGLVRTRCGNQGCSGPKDQQIKTDKFLSVLGFKYVIVNSQKGKGRALKEQDFMQELRRFKERIKKT